MSEPLFVLDPHNHATASGAAPYTAGAHTPRGSGNLLRTILLLVGAGIVLALAIPVFNMWRDFIRLNLSGVETTARVEDTYIDTDSDGNEYYRVIYTFDYTSADGSTGEQRAEVSISESQYEQLEVGQSLPIVYDASNPAITAPGKPAPWSALLSTAVLLLVGGMFGYFWAADRRAEQHAHQLQQHGQLLHGNITSINGYYDSDDNSYEVALEYSFTTPQGHTLQNEERRIRNDLTGQPLPPVGTRVAIWYVSDQNYVLL